MASHTEGPRLPERLLGYTKPSPAAVMTRGLTAIADACHIDAPGAVVLLAHCWRSWLNHPDYEQWHEDSDAFDRKWNITPRLDKHLDGTWFLHPMCMGGFDHPPGLDGHTRSYVLGGPQTIISRIPWGTRTLGDFAGILPLDAGMPMPFHVRIATVSWSLKRGGQGYHARQKLKELLPRKLRTWVNKASKAKNRTKASLIKNPPEGWPEWFSEQTGSSPSWHNRHLWPESYRNRTKKQIWIDEFIPPEIKAMIEQYINIDMFWDCSTGKVHPDKVIDYVTHQRRLL